MRVARYLLVGVVAVAACADTGSDSADNPSSDMADPNTQANTSPSLASDGTDSTEADLRNRNRDAGSADAGRGSVNADAGHTSDAAVPVGDAGGTGTADGGAAPSADAGSVSGVWRPFNASSPWNTLIPANPVLAPDSAALVADLRTSSPYGEHLDINMAGYSIPVYYANASTPTVDMLCDLGGLGFTGNAGFNAHANVPMPAGAAPDPQGDHHLCIIDRARNIEWGMWDTHNDGGKWTCGVGATADLAGDGLRPYKPNNPTWYTSHGARACGFPLIAGLIRTEEIDAGRIDHALILAYPHIRSGFYMSPASTAQARSGNDAISTRGIPCGGHVQLDPTLDLDSLGLSRGGRIVAEALQRYGAYVGDYSGAISLYAENAPSAQAHWQGVLQTYEFQNLLDMGRLRVLKFGDLTDDGNGN